MTLSPGTRIGPYEIVAAIGAGGMGEVYRARDTKLNRDAAIKVLPATFAEDANGVSRLRREAQVLASLNHPHIASIYGLEETDDSLALALELVEGHDLTQRLERGALPVHEAIACAHQIVEGLDAAHEKGIVHRDLKPANIKLTEDGVVNLFVRRIDRAEASEVPGSSGVNSAAFSPDGRSVVFVAGSAEVTRVSLVDHQRQVVASGAAVGNGLGWSPTDVVFGRDGALWTVSPGGGTPRALTVLDAARGEVLHDQPTVLADERLVLFSSLTAEPGEGRIEAVSIQGGARSVVVERAVSPVWSPTGHLLFARDGAVLAVPFDPGGVTTRGAAVPVIPAGVVGRLVSGGLAMGRSPSGTLVYAPTGFLDKNVVSVGRDGAARSLGLPSAPYANPRVSPDGRRLLVQVEARFVEALDLDRGTRSRLTSSEWGTTYPTWSADGSRVVVRRLDAPVWMAADGSGESAPLPGGAINDWPCSPGPDPDSIVAVRTQPETSGDVFLMSISGAFEPRPLVATPSYEGGAQLSPDQGWLLYQSDSSGQAEIYVRPYPDLDRQWQVSEGGGVQPVWSRRGREIYYRNGRDVVAVSIDTTGNEPVLGKPTTLFADEYEFSLGISIPNYDVMPDGRFVMLRRSFSGGKLRVVVNWTEELKRVLAAGGVR